MPYDFDTPVDRRQSDSLKWEVGEGELPMWVADMDFETAPEIRKALAERVAHGVFGYSVIPPAWNQAYVDWWKTRHGYRMDPDWLIFCTGVIPAISSLVRKLTTPAEKVLIQTPVYNIFFNSILNNGRQVQECPLVCNNGNYEIDFAALEAALSDPQVTLMLLCNPHNPVGKIWEPETLAQIGALCRKHHVIVIADEIHCDLTDPGYAYTPFASVSETCRENSITCLAPTKSFNLAGLQTAAVSVPDPVLRHKVWRALNTDEVAEPGALAVPAAVAAFREGGPWLDALRAYLAENKQVAARFLAEKLPLLRLTPQHATYLLWIDCSKVSADSAALARALRQQTGLYLSAGAAYGGDGDRYLRMNVACPRALLLDGLARLQKGMASLSI